MNVIHFKSQGNKKIAFCCVDNINTYTSGWTKELIKNISDYTISNVIGKGYDLFQGFDENALLTNTANLDYEYAVVFSTGTEFINGSNFFNAIDTLTNTDFFIAGHVLDRGDAYYELHHQCYFVNLKTYKELGYPLVGQQRLGDVHHQETPWRSTTNWHDDYTPKEVSAGHKMSQRYNHKCHGWYILKVAFENNLQVLVFNESIRNNKKHYYPENQNEFLKHSEWLIARQNYCASTFVHTENTDQTILAYQKFTQVLTPASGTNYKNLISDSEKSTVIFYDYNPSALDYWRSQVTDSDMVTYKFVQLDLLGPIDLSTVLDTSNNNTFINFSNIFCYEGTAAFASLQFRLYKENQLVDHIRELMPEAHVHFSARAASGFATMNGNRVELSDLQCPTWHMNGEWQC